MIFTFGAKDLLVFSKLRVCGTNNVLCSRSLEIMISKTLWFRETNMLKKFH